MKNKTILEKINFISSRFEIVFTTILLAGILIVGTLQVIMRYVFNSSLSWSEEVMRYAFIWMVYVGGAITARKKGHVKLELFENMLPAKGRKILYYIQNILVIIGLLVLIWAGYDLCMRNLTSMTSALVISRAWAYAAIPAGSLCMVIAMILTMITQPYVDKNYNADEEAAKAAEEARQSLWEEEGKDGEK